MKTSTSLRIAGIAYALALTGCATSKDYELYASTQKAIALAKSDADAARYKALSDIAANGSDVSKVAAVMGLAFANSGAGSTPQPVIQAPVSAGETALRWAQIVLPSATQLYGINSATRLGIAQSNNSARVAESTNSAFVGIAGKIQAPAANYSYGANSGAYSGTSVVGANSGASSGNTANPTTTTTTTTTSTANPTTTTSTANPTTTTSTANPTTTTSLPSGKVCSVDSAGLLTCL